MKYTDKSNITILFVHNQIESETQLVQNC